MDKEEIVLHVFYIAVIVFSNLWIYYKMKAIKERIEFPFAEVYLNRGGKDRLIKRVYSFCAYLEISRLIHTNKSSSNKHTIRIKHNSKTVLFERISKEVKEEIENMI